MRNNKSYIDLIKQSSYWMFGLVLHSFFTIIEFMIELMIAKYIAYIQEQENITLAHFVNKIRIMCAIPIPFSYLYWPTKFPAIFRK